MPFHIMVVDDNELFNRSVCKELIRGGYKAFGVYNGKDAVAAMEKAPDIALLDMKLPDKNGLSVLKIIKKCQSDCEVIMLTHVADTKVAVEAMKAGAFNYIVKSSDLEELFLTIDNVLEKIKLRRNVSDYKKAEINKYRRDNIVMVSDNVKKLYDLADKVAQECTTCFILGENGTGKGLLARYIHYASGRRNKPFVDVSCCNISESLMESQLFGHEKGAFTGASGKKLGCFERAYGGTIFLDEIGDIQPGLQAKLLKVIEEKTFERVGGEKPIKVDVRIIAATNRDMEKAVREKKFRADLYYRLKVVPIKTIPLRERQEDIIPMAERFIALFSIEFKKEIKTLDKEAYDGLLKNKWWGNVRELRNAIERAVLLGKGNSISKEDLMLDSKNEPLTQSDASNLSVDIGIKRLEEVERDYCEKVFKCYNQNLSRAAKALGVSRDRLRRKLPQEH